MRRAFALVVVGGLLVSATAANAAAVPRLAGTESFAGSPFDFDQVSILCAGSTTERDTSLAYAGSASLKVHTENDSKCEPYARGIFETNAPNHLESEDDFWFGAAIYLPKGFYEAHTSYTDLLRIDSYVKDDGTNTPFEERKEINFACWDNDDLYVRTAVGSTNKELIGPISPTKLPEGTWNWVEMHIRLDVQEGLTELFINGASMGGSSHGNTFNKGAPFNRLRYGLVSTGTGGSGNLTAYFDRASISPTKRDPNPLETESRVSLWPLNESTGTLTADTTGVAPGSYINGPTLGAPGIVAGSTAASFDGLNDYVAITPPLPLNTKAGVTLEAWVKPDVLQGSVIRRNNSYELRPQSDGSILFRVWVGEIAQSLTSAKNTISTGEIRHLVGTYDGANMKIYADGTQIASQSQTGRISHSSSTLYIGRNDGSSTYFDGVIDDPAIYSEALTAAAVLDAFESGDTHGAILIQVPNQSATTDLSAWSTPSLGTLTRFTSGSYDPPPYSAPASFRLEYKGGGSKPVATTASNKVVTKLEAEHAYTFRFRSRAGQGDVTSPTGGCIRLYLANNKEGIYCISQGDDKNWQLHEVTFKLAANAESYRVELNVAPEGFLGYYIGSVLFDDIELVQAG